MSLKIDITIVIEKEAVYFNIMGKSSPFILSCNLFNKETIINAVNIRTNVIEYIIIIL